MEFFNRETAVTRREFLKLVGLTLAVTLLEPKRLFYRSAEQRGGASIETTFRVEYKTLKPVLKFIPPTATVASHKKTYKVKGVSPAEII